MTPWLEMWTSVKLIKASAYELINNSQNLQHVDSKSVERVAKNILKEASEMEFLIDSSMREAERK